MRYIYCSKAACYNDRMSTDTKFWCALIAMLVSGMGVIRFFGPVFNGIEQGSGWDIFGLIVSTLALLVSAACYYYLKSARRNLKDIHRPIHSRTESVNREKLDKKVIVCYNEKIGY